MIEKVFAQPSVVPPINPGDLGGQPWDDLGEIAQFVVSKLVLPIMAGLIILFIFWSGYQFITSAGDPEKANKARANLTYSVIGLILVLLAYFLVQFFALLAKQAAP